MIAKTLVVVGFAAVASAAIVDELVKELPEIGPIPFNLYSGYIPTNKNRKLHYMFAESQDNPAKDPLVIWFNGGPGCSSMMGFL